MFPGFLALQTGSVNRRKSSLCRYGVTYYFAGMPVESHVKFFAPLDKALSKEPYNLNTPEKYYIDKAGVDPAIVQFLPPARDEIAALLDVLKDNVVVSYAGTTVEKQGLEELASLLGIDVPRIYFVDVRDLFDVFYPNAVDKGLIEGRKKEHICHFLDLEYHHTTRGLNDAYNSGDIFYTLYQQYCIAGESVFDFASRHGCVAVLHNRPTPRWVVRR